MWLIENNSKTKLHGSTYLAGFTIYTKTIVRKTCWKWTIFKNTIYQAHVSWVGVETLSNYRSNYRVTYEFWLFGTLFGAIIYGFTLKELI